MVGNLAYFKNFILLILCFVLSVKVEFIEIWTNFERSGLIDKQLSPALYMHDLLVGSQVNLYNLITFDFYSDFV